MEVLLRIGCAPALVAIFELEGPTRLLHTAESPADLDALDHWVRSSELRRAAVGFAGLDRAAQGGRERGRAWAEVLRREGGGVERIVEMLLDGL